MDAIELHENEMWLGGIQEEDYPAMTQRFFDDRKPNYFESQMITGFD